MTNTVAFRKYCCMFFLINCLYHSEQASISTTNGKGKRQLYYVRPISKIRKWTLLKIVYREIKIKLYTSRFIRKVESSSTKGRQWQKVTSEMEADNGRRTHERAFVFRKYPCIDFTQRTWVCVGPLSNLDIFRVKTRSKKAKASDWYQRIGWRIEFTDDRLKFSHGKLRAIVQAIELPLWHRSCHTEKY